MFEKWRELFERYESNYMQDPSMFYYKELTDLQERTNVVHNVANKWFEAIEAADKAEQPMRVMPNLFEPIPTTEEANRIIKLFDEFTLNEVEYHMSYWRDKGLMDKGIATTEPTRFDELEGLSRKAFAQDIWRVIRQEFPEEENPNLLKEKALPN